MRVRKSVLSGQEGISEPFTVNLPQVSPNKNGVKKFVKGCQRCTAGAAK